jgi:thiamine-phosphate pyrophosphorylase
MLLPVSSVHERLDAALLYFVCDRRPGGRPLAGVLAAALRGGVDVFQLRDKRATDAEVLAAAAQARELCSAAGALLIVNDRPDLAVAAGADGVHVGQDDMPVDRARRLVGDDAIVGLSTHSMQQAQAGGRSGADYIAVGPVHATPTKAGRPAIGVGPLAYAASHVDVPWFAIGGIDPTTVGAVVKAGARRIVVVRAIADASDPEATARALRAAVDGERRGPA